jgi:hypothetical protein
MNKLFFSRLPLVALAILVLIFSGCTKTVSTTPPAPTTTSLVYTNDAYTPVLITLNGVSSTIAPGASATFTGTPGSAVSGAAATSGLTATNNVVGAVINWTIADQFPSTGSTTKTLDVSPTFFFLKIDNTSIYGVTGVYVNFDLLAQSFDNINFGNGTFNIGYYPAYSNSNIRCIGPGNVYWQINTILPNTQNQQFLFTLAN